MPVDCSVGYGCPCFLTPAMFCMWTLNLLSLSVSLSLCRRLLLCDLVVGVSMLFCNLILLGRS